MELKLKSYLYLPAAIKKDQPLKASGWKKKPNFL